MKKIYYILSALFLCVVATSAQEAGKTVVIKTNIGTMKAILYNDVPNHTRTFIERAKRGDFNGTLFTRVLPEFMIQGGAPDSKNAPAGAKCGFGDPSAEIPPEINEKYFHKKGALAAPRQPDDVPAKEIGHVAILYRTGEGLSGNRARYVRAYRQLSGPAKGPEGVLRTGTCGAEYDKDE